TTKIKDFSNLLIGMRTDTEADISNAVNAVNLALDNINNLNGEITRAMNAGQSTADLEDQRDLSVATVAKYINITTFKSGGVMSVLTSQGQSLVDNDVHKLFFSSSNILPASYYPGGGLSGLTIDSPSGTDIAQANLGGQLGTLFDLRDTTLPQYVTQIDEFSQRLAERFNNEGLKLFTDPSGNVPPNVSNVSPPLGYLGFSAQIQVNNSIVADPNLIRNGTTGNVELSGSNEVIRRISQFALGPYQNQQASGSTPILGIGALTTNLPLTTRNTVVGTVNIASYAPNLSTAPGLTLPGAFTLTIGGVPQTIDILATDTAADVVNTINGFFPGAASINSLGQLNLTASGVAPAATITIGDGPASPPAPNPPIGGAGIAALGLSFTSTLQPQPSFQVQVGTRAPVTISIAPADTSVELLAKLNAIPGLGQWLTASLNGANGLLLVPKDGGNLTITDGIGAPLAALGMTVSNIAPPPFAQNNLGPNSTLSTGLLGNSTLQDYINSLIGSQGEADNLNKAQQTQETSFLQTLDARNKNNSGVNIDQEMSDLIRIQSAYSAAAKMISASQKLFDDLLSALQ
ncbi:MAG: hypothetical protein HY052_07505, partial [Proteobacteria bacterium]|nr:hypothetical protein [Pseudomonadota bacterium]